ncbi:MAG: hypothetical protein ACI4JA_00610 [Oscillospiraceae bacterium]
MNDNMRIIREAEELVRSASGEHCAAYSELCGSKCAEAVLSVLDGELRMAEQLKQLESFFAPQSSEPLANEYEINKFIAIDN